MEKEGCNSGKSVIRGNEIRGTEIQGKVVQPSKARSIFDELETNEIMQIAWQLVLECDCNLIWLIKLLTACFNSETIVK